MPFIVQNTIKPWALFLSQRPINYENYTCPGPWTYCFIKVPMNKLKALKNVLLAFPPAHTSSMEPAAWVGLIHSDVLQKTELTSSGSFSRLESYGELGPLEQMTRLGSCVCFSCCHSCPRPFVLVWCPLRGCMVMDKESKERVEICPRHVVFS